MGEFYEMPHIHSHRPKLSSLVPGLSFKLPRFTRVNSIISTYINMLFLDFTIN